LLLQPPELAGTVGMGLHSVVLHVSIGETISYITHSLSNYTDKVEQRLIFKPKSVFTIYFTQPP